MGQLARAALLTALLNHSTRAQQQCSGGDLRCPCISSYEGFNVSGALNEELLVSVDGTDHAYGPGYGLHSCRAHDSNTAPYCDAAGYPTWCSFSWCYVNASSCGLSASPSSYVPDLYYSYEACGNTDTFTSYYTHRDGVVTLCSVFSTPAEAAHDNQRPLTGTCGDTDTMAQVEAVVAAANALNDGRGFALRKTDDDARYDPSRVTRYYHFNYTVRTYPSGQWGAVGRRLSTDLFSSDACDVVIGMASGCPDAEITAQALLANESKRIYVTGRGPEAVLRQHGDNQSYLFSSHVRSDEYATYSMNYYYHLGARSMAIVHEDADDVFYAGLGRYTLQYAATRGFDVRYNATIDGSADLPELEARLAKAHATRSDVLVLVMREAEFRRALEMLKAMRSSHVYKALWWQGVPWGNGTCHGLAEECEFAAGASQMGLEQALKDYTDPLLGMTYEELQQTYVAGGAASLVGFPDGAMIPSMVAQAMQTLFKFREVTTPRRPLACPLDSELLREFLRSGETVATTFCGPVRFNEYGQNVGRVATTLQIRGGIARVALSTCLQGSGEHAFNYPAPAFADCSEDAHERKWDHEADCLLCAASTCVRWDRQVDRVRSVVGWLIGATLLIVLARLVFRHRQNHLSEIKIKQEEDQANFQRLQSAVNQVAVLEFYMCFVKFEDLKAHGKLISHERVRAKDQLTILDTFADVKRFVDANQVTFISHQWLAGDSPDPEGVHFKAIVDAVSALNDRLVKMCNPKASKPVYLWLDYISIPQANKTMQSLSISSLALYASMPDYFIVVAPPARHVDKDCACNKETYLRRGWCRLEQWARITVGGTRDMFIWDGKLKMLCSPDKERNEKWILIAIRVFEGDFTDKGDLNKIVGTCLGLWATAYYTHRAIIGATPQSDCKSTSQSDLMRTGGGKSSPNRRKDSDDNLRAFHEKLHGRSIGREKVYREKVATETSHTIYDIVSMRKHEIFPAAYFGDLVDLLESAIDNRKIVPILRSHKTAGLVDDGKQARRVKRAAREEARDVENRSLRRRAARVARREEAGEHATTSALTTEELAARAALRWARRVVTEEDGEPA